MTDRQQTVDTITNHLQTVLPGAKGKELREVSDLREFGEFDSIAILELLVWLETTFGVSISDEDLTVDRFDSVGKIADYVMDRLK